jgi:lipopolysaccharide/colanic/teichoic acid biosynthesis glycosyltransferase
MVFTRGSRVILRIKAGSGVILRLLLPRRRWRKAAPFGSSTTGGGSKMSTVAAGDLHGNDCPLAVERVTVRPRGPLPPPPALYVRCKAALDFTLALLLLTLTAPVLLLAMLAVRLTSRGPALYSQTRLGKGGRPFTIYKLRTMVHRCESLTGARWSVPGDPRITPLGKFLRKTHLDELPQLWNVLRGDMSLVGPRPERPEFVPQLEQAIAHYRGRLLVKPGVTGLAQVQLPPDTDLASVCLKLAYDLHYVRHAGLWLDCRIILSTAFKMVAAPFGLLRRLFRFPDRALVEHQYRELPQEPRPAPRAQTA